MVKFFYISLEDLQRRDEQTVPIIVVKCIEALVLHGHGKKEMYAAWQTTEITLQRIRNTIPYRSSSVICALSNRRLKTFNI